MQEAAQYKTYKNLIVYQKAKLLSLDLINYFSEKRIGRIHEFVVSQLLRSATSIGANIAEGYGRHYRKNYRQFISIARGSSYETDYWLEILSGAKLLRQADADNFLDRNVEITKMLTVMMKRLETVPN